jgi:hypothetical protein
LQQDKTVGESSPTASWEPKRRKEKGERRNGREMASQLGYPPNQKDGAFSSRFAVYIFEKKKTGL